MNPTRDSLSAAGARRAQAILELASQVLDERARQRRARRATSAAMALALVAVVIAPFSLPQPQPTSVSPLAATPKFIERLSDDALLDELAKLGIDAGLIDVAGAVRIVRSDGSPLEFPAPVPPTSS